MKYPMSSSSYSHPQWVIWRRCINIFDFINLTLTVTFNYQDPHNLSGSFDAANVPDSESADKYYPQEPLRRSDPTPDGDADTPPPLPSKLEARSINIGA
jgi:hypothetical protein